MKYYTLNITRSLVREGEKPMTATPKNIVSYALENCYTPRDIWREQCFIVFVNNQSHITGHFLLGVGGFESVTMDRRLACLAMLGSGEGKGVLVHNHPGGDPKPSVTDINQTQQIRNAFSAINCELLDHIVIGDGRYFSFYEETENNYKV